MNDIELKTWLDKEVSKRDVVGELSLDKPDPLLIASKYKDSYISVICALFAYGNAALIVRFLQSLDFSLLDEGEEKIISSLSGSYYRFQNTKDVIALFIALRRAKLQSSLEDIFLQGYKRENNILEGLATLINALEEFYPYESRGYRFLLGLAPTLKSKSTYKRWNMFLRWMVRKDSLDMGLWKSVEKKDLLMPLDTHTFQTSRKLGLLQRKSYDLKAVIELTNKLKEFDPNDPVKYDFALYRLGQEGALTNI